MKNVYFVTKGHFYATRQICCDGKGCSLATENPLQWNVVWNVTAD